MNEKVVPLPSVQIIGAQKAGTSAIANWMVEGGLHGPLVFDNEPWYYSKETHFFDIDWRFNRGLDFYAKRFQGFERRAMDATPDTIAFPERVYSLYQSAGGGQVNTVKIIVILRNPIERELSLYNHLAFDCRNLPASERTNWHNQVLKPDDSIMTFDEFVQNVSVPALGRSDAEDHGSGRSSRHNLYANHLQVWFELFDRKQILVLSYDELSSNPERVQKRIEMFLGCSIPGSLPRSNCNDSIHKVRHPSAEARRVLQSILSTHNARLYKLLEDNPGPSIEQKPFPPFTM